MARTKQTARRKRSRSRSRERVYTRPLKPRVKRQRRLRSQRSRSGSRTRRQGSRLLRQIYYPSGDKRFYTVATKTGYVRPPISSAEMKKRLDALVAKRRSLK